MKTKYCLNSSVSFKQINNSHTNRSKSKQTHSFSKSSRFQTIQPYCQKNTYQGPVINRKKSGISIGKCQRSDFTQSLSAAPGVSKYSLKQMFNQNDMSKKGYTLRLSRQKVDFGNYINKSNLIVPSPFQYNNPKDEILSKPPCYSMSARTKVVDKTRSILSQNNNPGPGAYQNPQILNTSNKLNSVSRYSNQNGYSTSKSKRFESSDNKVPGPGNYRHLNGLSNVGRYVVSNKIGGTQAIFNRDKRISKFQSIQTQAAEKPGPGAYRMPSEFGQYDGDVYQHYNTISVSRQRGRLTSGLN